MSRFVNGRGTNAQVAEKLDLFLATAKNDADRALRTAGLLLRDEIVAQLSQPGTGRRYRVRKVKYRTSKSTGTRKRLKDKASDFHTASSPGDPPAPELGNLKRSAYVEKSGRQSYHVGVNTPYAAALEFGTTTAGKSKGVTIEARPFMAPAIAIWRGKVGHLFRATFGRGGNK